MGNSYEDKPFPVGKIVMFLVVFMVICLGLDWISAGENFFLYKFWAPKQENARREVYEGTKSYHQGSIQRLNNLCSQAKVADEVHQPMLYDVIKQEYAEWDMNDVPIYLQNCVLMSRSK